MKMMLVGILVALVASQYIVKLKGESRLPMVAHLAVIEELTQGNRTLNGVDKVYENLGGMYYARFSDAVLSKVKEMAEVEYVEADKEVRIVGQQQFATWGISRLSQRARLSGGSYTYSYKGDGAGVAVYIIDTGIMVSHPEFEGRARFGARFAGNNDEDEHGHGTHCAGTVGSLTYGVAKKVDLVAVKVFDGSGSGTDSGVLSAIDWALGDKKGIKGNVISMSLGGEKSQALNDAVEKAYLSGFVVAVAAGNENQDACDVSPASSPSAITVGATDINDARASFSNYGRCLDVFAPGVDIQSTWNNGATNSISGTSMATPHVAGLAAYLLSQNQMSTSQLTANLLALATKNIVSDAGQASPNTFAFNGFA